MHVGYALLMTAAILLGYNGAASTNATAGTTLSTMNSAERFQSFEAGGVKRRYLSKNEDAMNEMRAYSGALTKIDELVDPKKLDDALTDLGKMKTLFKRWNSDAAVSEQVVKRLSSDPLTFAKYNSLVLTFNGYRIKAAERAAKLAKEKKLVDALVSPTTLKAALNDPAKTRALFKQWNADDEIAMKVIERLVGNARTFETYNSLVLDFNTYRMQMAKLA
ncbi:unnamed protein product [Phytophthora lilii]|uniref:RxLR effector protein n=1 Tax=Phytophthora lilii TaxID=2077276 RepID=A0A9W6X5S3_9STRA|nr:unnamed protein product [Phytophthora lilii]